MTNATIIEVKSLAVESAEIEGKTVGGISVFDGNELLSFLFQTEHVIVLRDILAFHVGKHLRHTTLEKVREEEFISLKSETRVSSHQHIIFVTKCKVEADDRSMNLILETLDGPYSLSMDNVSVVHFERELREEFIETLSSGERTH